MVAQKKNTYYLIIETIGNLARKTIPVTTTIRGLYSTQAKAIAELFHLATKELDQGTIFCNPPSDLPAPISEIIHSQTHNGETSIMGYNASRFSIIRLQIKIISLDISTLITT